MAIILNKTRFAYFFPYVARLPQGKTEPDDKKFTSSYIIETDGDEHKLVSKEIERVAEEKWGARAPGILKKLYAENRVCLKTGDSVTNKEGEKDENFAGKMFVRTSNRHNEAPTIYTREEKEVTAENKGVLDRNPESRSPRSGDYGQARINIWAQDNKFGLRINASLIAVIFREEGEPMGRGQESSESVLQGFNQGYDKSMME